MARRTGRHRNQGLSHGRSEYGTPDRDQDDQQPDEPEQDLPKTGFCGSVHLERSCVYWLITHTLPQKERSVQFAVAKVRKTGMTRLSKNVYVVRAPEQGSSGIIQALCELYRYRELLVAWTIRDVKVRYKQTLLGIVWAILQPALPTIVFSIIFTHFIPISTGEIPYPIFSYVAALPWTFSANSLSLSTSILISNMHLITKIYFPREILPLATIAACFLDLLVGSVVFAVLFAWYHIPIHWHLIPAILIPLLAQLFLTIGLALILAGATVFYRDVRFITPVGLQFWMYVTPIIYPLTVVPPQYRFLYSLNPMTGIIESYREIILHGTWPDWQLLGTAGVLSLLIFLAGYLWFKHVEIRFADII
ncbi:MAG: ABC transporter permease [Chloroflexia bacterium]